MSPFCIHIRKQYICVFLSYVVNTISQYHQIPNDKHNEVSEKLEMKYISSNFNRMNHIIDRRTKFEGNILVEGEIVA